MAEDKPATDNTPYAKHEAEIHLRHLRESVNDLSRCLQIILLAAIKVLLREPQEDDYGLAILIGENAVNKWGILKWKSTIKQGWRMVIDKKASA